MLERTMATEINEARVTLKVRASTDGLTWSYANRSIIETRHLKFGQIIGTRLSSQEADTVLHVDYAAVIVGKIKNVLLRHTTVSFFASDVICTEMSDCINKHVTDTQTHRPRRLLVFANPMSGSQESVTSYNYTVKPLFDIAGVTAQFIVTQHARHPAEVLGSYDLSTIDGVISMGGDGSNGHVFNALMKKTMKDAGLDMESAEPVSPRVTFGVLPSGSSCALAASTFLSSDLETAALSIILGQTLRSDAGIVRHKGKFHGYLLLFSMTGCYNQAILKLENLRFLKKLRYALITPLIWWNFSVYDVEIQYLPAPEDKRQFRYASPPNPDAEKPIFSTVDGTLPGWKTFRGKVANVMIGHMHLAKFIKRDSMTPYEKPGLSSGMFRLAIDKFQTFSEIMKYYIFVNRSGDRKVAPREMIEQIDVSEVKVRILGNDPSRASLALEAEPYDVLEYSIKSSEKLYRTFVIDHALVSETLEHMTQ